MGGSSPMNNNFYKKVMEKMPTGYAYHKIICDQEGIPLDYEFIEINSAFETMTGLKKSDVIGNRVSDILPDIIKSEFDWIKFYGEIAVDGGEKFFEQFSEPLKRWYRVEAYSPNENYFITFFTDITKEKEQVLELDHFFNINLDLLCIADIEGNFIKVSNEWESIIGYTKETLEKRKFIEFVHPDDMEATLEAMSRLGKQEQIINFVNRFRCKDGLYRYIEWRSQPNGTLIYAAARDITEHKQLVLDLQLARDELTLLLENIPTQMWYLKDFKTYGSINKSHADFLGYDKKDIEHKSIFDVYYKEEANVSVETNKQVFDEKKPINNEEWLLNTKKEKRLLRITRTPKISDNGDVEFIICSAEDITEQKDLEAQVQIKEKLLFAVFDFTQELLLNSDSYEAITKGFALLGEATGIDRIYYWENSYDIESNQEYTSQKLEWCAEGITPQIDVIDLQNVPFKEVPDFVEPLSKGEIIKSLVKDMKDGNTKSLLKEQEIISILVLPVFANHKFWGFIGFDDCRYEKVWTEVEISLLKLFTLSLSKSIERNSLERETRQARQNFNNFFNTIDELLCVLDLEGRIIDVNQTVTNRLGYLRNELIGESILMLHPSNRKKETEETLLDMMAYKKKVNYLPVIGKQGTEISVETRVIWGEWDGQPALFIATKDISEMKKSEEKFSKAFHSSGALMFISKKEDNSLIDANDSFLSVLGFKSADIINRKFSDLNIFIDDEQIENISNELEQNGKLREMEVFITGKNNELITGIMNIESIYLGDILCWMTTIIDITKQKKIELELIQTKELAEAANIVKSQFLSNMSHEIRTPMNAVIGFTELLANTSLMPEQQNIINEIKTSSQILLSLINDILDLEKMEAGKLKMEILPLELQRIIDNAVSQVRVKSEEKGISIHTTIEDDVPKLLSGDPLRLQQVLTNLIDNAVKFTNAGRVVIRVKFIESSGEQIKLQFSVRDTGIGMTEEEIKKVFEPFYQPEHSDGRRYGGTGLGLAICKNIITLHGGKIWVDSYLGKGTTFFFTVSFSTSQKVIKVRTQGCDNAFQLPDKELIEQLRGVHVLVVEDNEINQQVLLAMLRTAGMFVTITDNGIEAISYIKSNQYEIVLMDIRMPDMDGYEVTAEIRKERCIEELPIIAVTADAMLGERKKYLEAGINDFITKPIGRAHLFQTMVRWIRKGQELLSEENSYPIGISIKVPLIYDDLTRDENIIPNINGIDVDNAVSRLGGSQKFFNKLLIKFLNNQEHVIAKIRQALQSDDLNTAERLAHTLKGVAGELSAHEVYSIAAELETKIHIKNLEDTVLLLEQLEQVLTGLFISIDSMKKGYEEVAITNLVSIDCFTLWPLIDKLSKLLHDNDMDSIECLEEFEKYTKQTSIASKVAEMKAYGEQYLFEEALTVLDDIKTILAEEEKSIYE